MSFRFSAAFYAFCFGTILCGQTKPDSKETLLELHRPFEGQLLPEQTDSYAVELASGQFAHVVALQKGVNVTLRVTNPAGKTITTAGIRFEFFGPEQISWIAETPGRYRVEVAVFERVKFSGPYKIELSRVATADERDRIRLKAERSTDAAVMLPSRSKGQMLVAIEAYEKARGLWHSIAEVHEEARCAKQVAILYYLLNQPRKSLEELDRALALFRSAGESHGEASVLRSISAAYSKLGNESRSDTYVKQSDAVLESLRKGQRRAEYDKMLLQLLTTSVNPDGTMWRPLHFYAAWHNFKDHGEKLDIWHRLAKAYSTDMDIEWFDAAAPYTMGGVYARLGDLPRAWDYYRQALEFPRPRKYPHVYQVEFNFLRNAGKTFAESGDYAKAVDSYQKALTLPFEVGVDYETPQSLLNLNFALLALSIRRSLNDKQGELRMLRLVSQSASARGKNEQALDYLQQALTASQSLHDRSSEASILVDYGVFYADRGETQKSLEYYQHAVSLARAAHNQAIEINALDNLGSAYSNIGEIPKAIEYHQQALMMSTTPTQKAGPQLHLGIDYYRLGDVSKATNWIDEAHSSSTTAWLSSRISIYTAGLRVRLASVERWQAEVELDKGNPGSAITKLESALADIRECGDSVGEGLMLRALGQAYEKSGNTDKAWEQYQLALSNLRDVGHRAGEASTLNAMAHFWSDRGQPNVAIWFGKQAVNVLQSIRRDNQGMQDDLRRGYERTVEGKYRYLASLLVEQRRFSEAQEVLDLLKEKETSDFIRRDGVTNALRPATLLDEEKKALSRYEEISNDIFALGILRTNLLSKNGPDSNQAAQLSDVEQDLAAANAVMNRFLREQEQHFAPESKGTRRIEDFREASGLKSTLRKLGPDAVVIYTLLSNDRYVAMLVTADANKAYTTPINEKEFNDKIFSFCQQLQNRNSDPQPLAKEIYQIVFPDDLRKDLETIHAKRIMWSLDSTLRYIPIAALHDGKQYLVSRFQNSLITPASLARLAEVPEKEWRGVGFGVSEQKPDFSALPSVPAELHGIFRETSSGPEPVPGSVRLNADFTRQTFMRALRTPEKSVVHIATHFDSRPGNAANSNLLLGDGSKLNLAEIEASEQLFDGVDLLTLSACSTAFTNQSEDGREIDSLGTIAQRLGAKGVIASLWSVNDEATAHLMQMMYRLRQDNPGIGKGEALRQAQASMESDKLRSHTAGTEPDRGVKAAVDATTRRSNGWSHPYYWAPFILIGNWR